MIEVGLYGNKMDNDYKTHSMLAASNTWLKKKIGISLVFQYTAACWRNLPIEGSLLGWNIFDVWIHVHWRF